MQSALKRPRRPRYADLADANADCQCPGNPQQEREHCQEPGKIHMLHSVMAAQLDNIESQQVEAPPAADVSNQDDAAVLEEEIRELQHVVRCSSW